MLELISIFPVKEKRSFESPSHDTYRFKYYPTCIVQEAERGPLEKTGFQNHRKEPG